MTEEKEVSDEVCVDMNRRPLTPEETTRLTNVISRKYPEGKLRFLEPGWHNDPDVSESGALVETIMRKHFSNQ